MLGWNLLTQIARFHEVWALTNSDDRGSIESALKEEPVPNLHFRYVGLPPPLHPLLRFQGGHQFYYFLWQIRAYFEARKLHRKLRFDLFHHITYANDWMVSFIGAFLPIPYIRGPGGGAHRTPKGFEGEYSLGGRLWEKIRTLGQWLFRHDPIFVRGQRRARTILLCNREAIANIPPSWAHKARLFPVNGVSSRDLALTNPAKVNNGKFRVLSAGSLIRVKGFSLAIKAFKEFADRHPETDFSIIGSGPEESRLRAMVDRCQLQDKVDLVQAVPRDELLARMAECDVFLFPSLRDGGGAVVLEAMSVGKPVVCLDTGGPGMHVTEKSGVKITAASAANAVHELAGALERLYLDEGLRQEMGEAAKERAALVYHWDRLGDSLLEIYRQGLGGEGCQQA
jgi:glycosyltransferase involved in cell wall biosynthesis